MKRTFAIPLAGLIALVGTSAVNAANISFMGAKLPPQMEGFKKLFNEYSRQSKVQIKPTALDWTAYNEKVLVSIAAGKFNELYTGGTDFGWMARAGVLSPLNSYIKTSKLNLNVQSPAAIKALSMGGQLYVVPFQFGPVVLFYNKNLFDAAGMRYPTSNWSDKSWNWQAYVEAAKKLTKRDANGRIIQSGIGGMQWQFFYPWYFGGDWTDEGLTKSTLTDPNTIKGLQAVADLTLKDRVTGFDFNSGKAAMSVDGAWGMFNMKKTKFQWNIAASPWGTHHSVPAFFDGLALGRTPKSKQGFAFIKWLFSDNSRVSRWIEADSGWGSVPTIRSMQANYVENGKTKLPGVNFQVCVDAMEYATPMTLRYSKNWPKIESLISTAYGQVTSGKKTAKDAMESINKEVDRLIRTGGTR